MTNKQLSPEAQAVLDAAFPAYDDETLYIATGEQHAGKIAAAALRAAINQVVSPDPCGDDCCITVCEQIRSDFLSIANELEGK
tara:strand:+ start:2798 stop:3046 length:249 start_codon:yes stop_codon:yes gene_type:complete